MVIETVLTTLEVLSHVFTAIQRIDRLCETLRHNKTECTRLRERVMGLQSTLQRAQELEQAARRAA